MKKLISFIMVVAMLAASILVVPVAATEPNVAVSAWDGTATAQLPANKDGDVYLLESAADVANLAAYVAAGNNCQGVSFRLMCDIDIRNQKWNPIGTYMMPFKGSFDGNGHVIYNLNLANGASSNDAIGFFGNAVQGRIENLGIVSGAIEVADARYVGALAGMTNGVTFINCFNAANLTITPYNTSSDFGGLIGNANNNATVLTDCWNAGNITVNAINVKVNVGVGGICGTVAKGKSLEATNCYSIGNVDVKNANEWSGVGPFIGKATGTVSCANSSAGGSVTITGVESDNCFRGLFIGYRETTFTAENCTYDTSVTFNGTAVTGEMRNTEDQPNLDPTTKAIAITTSSAMVNNAVQNGTHGETVANSVRFVSELAFSATAFKECGFIVEIVNGDTAKSTTLSGKVVYTGLKAGNDTVAPTDGKTFIAYGISDIPTDTNATFKFTPYVVTLNGVTIYGTQGTVTMTGGDVPSAN